MNHPPQYRGGALQQHQLLSSQCHPVLQGFGTNLMIDSTQYQIPGFISSGGGTALLRATPTGNILKSKDLATTSTPTSSDFNCGKDTLVPPPSSDLLQQSFNKQNKSRKVMVDVSTMTDQEDSNEQSSNWQNTSVTPNAKVAEYLTSLRQFLKLDSPSFSLSTPNENKRRLGDVRIVSSPDGTRLYCCPECHMAYPDKSLLEPHLASHKIERRFVCGVCGAGLKRKEHLDRHQLSHSDERPYSCAACPKTFKRNEHLARHYIIHSGEKAQIERRFVCGVCGTGHARREHLERHQLAHTEDRPHACTACHKSFKRNEHLARHLLTHSGLKPHVCLECGKAFYRKDHLRKHLIAHQTKRIRLACDSKLPLT